MNCYTFRVKPDELTWRNGSELIDSSYSQVIGSEWIDQAVNGSQLLDNATQSYCRHYIILNGSFSVGMSISCDAIVNGANSSLNYELQCQWIIKEYNY